MSMVTPIFPIPLKTNSSKKNFYTTFLTPHKLTLCLLIELYAHRIIQPQHCVPFLDLVLEYFNVRTTD